MTRKICIVTGSRAEYGLLKGVIEGVRDTAGLKLQLIATGMHLSPEFGFTWREIAADGIEIDERIEILLSSDSPVGVSKAMGLGLIGFAEAYARLAPDLVVVLGDRFEIFAAAAAATIAALPVAHIHGGEVTEGAFDEAIRHSVTKMAQLHFVAAEPYWRRVVQLGEDPARVFLVGGLGIDAMQRVERMDRAELEDSLGFQLGTRNLLVTYHAPTVQGANPVSELDELLVALDAWDPDVHLLFTLPNADTGGRALIARIEAYASGRPNVHVVASLGQRRYFSALALVDGVVGNSSSGLLEAPSFKIGTVNIGDRQEGRLKAASVIDCAPQREAIVAALNKLFSAEFRENLRNVHNPYGEGGASSRIVDVIATQDLTGILKKHFYDLPVAGGLRGG